MLTSKRTDDSKLRKVGSLDVYIENKGTDHSSRVEYRPGETPRLILNPDFDYKMAVEGKFDDQPFAWTSVIAHEIGHFVARLLGSPVQTPLFEEIIGPVPGEEEAWGIAKYVYGAINEACKAFALDSYYNPKPCGQCTTCLAKKEEQLPNDVNWSEVLTNGTAHRTI